MIGKLLAIDGARMGGVPMIAETRYNLLGGGRREGKDRNRGGKPGCQDSRPRKLPTEHINSSSFESDLAQLLNREAMLTL